MKKTGRGLLRFLYGAIIIILGFVIFGGSDGLSNLALSIICTGGVTLVVYIPVALALGYLVDLFISRVIFHDSPSVKKESTSVSSNNQALNDYIASARNYQMGNDQIRENLKRSGWSDNEINKSL